MVNNYWYQEKDGKWNISLSSVKKHILESENLPKLHNEAISVVYNFKTDNIHIVTIDDRSFKIPASSIEELKNVPKEKLKKIELFSFPDSAIHLDCLDINILVDNLIKKADINHQAI